MDMRDALRLIRPLKSTVSERDVIAMVVQSRPEQTRLLALTDGVRRNKCRLDCGILFHHAIGQHVPTDHEVKESRLRVPLSNRPQVSLLSLIHHAATQEWGIAHDVIQLLRL